ncbi:hypothetical protein PYCCODRAFT_1432015 [Trametes coccinea BRFM310]|uniref:Fork-head domain-containing protein n=1 Tax=Trametes coccinea (strain BRFM310) TaxID=1353009 RepID=A0A1Y2IZV6_TRAC3|nr:hypothetical protein PYCCODRAFT_1432015 [Trametes coccinea BRFM310]
MSSLNDLLNPESSYESSLRLQAVRSPTTSTTSPTEKPAEPIKSVEIRPPPPPRTEIIIRAHEPHPDCPDTLACLPDTDGRPQHTLPVILRCTILGSPRKRLTIREIYAAMERKYPYYKTAGPAWKQSVRHHLSLNRLFERQPRPPSDPGFGSYWTVNLDAPPGTKRPRKRGGRPNKNDGSESGALTVLGPSSSSPPPPMVPRTLPALPGPPAPSMLPASSSQNTPQIPQPPPSATPSTASSVASAPSNTPPTSSTATSASVRPLLFSPQSPHHLSEDRIKAQSTSPRSPPHMHPQSLMQSLPHPRQHPHSLVHSQPPSHSLIKASPHVHPHPSSQVHLQSSSHSLVHPQQGSHTKPLSHNHSQPPPGHAHPQQHLMHPQSMPSPHERSSQTLSQQSSAHPLAQPSPFAHPPSHGPPSQQSSHSNSSHSHSHSHPPHGHPHSHSQRSPLNATNHTQSVSPIATLRPVDSRSFSHGSSIRSRAVYDDDDDDEMDWEEDGAGGPFSDEDYSGSEDMPYQYDPRHHNHNSNSFAGSSHRSYSASQAQPGRSVLHGAFSSFSGVDHPESTIERLKMEMAGLRRQSQDAVTASLRLSDELRASQEDAARAKEEATRSKAALKVAENMLEEEARRRIQAEKTLEEETRRRLAAEDALRQTEEHLRQYQAQAQAQRKSSGYSARS